MSLPDGVHAHPSWRRTLGSPTFDAPAPDARVGQSMSILTFTVERLADETGISGTGIVMEGVCFSDGTVVVRWLTPRPNGSVAIWRCWNDFWSVHIGRHPNNRSVIRWGDGTVWRHTPETEACESDDHPAGAIGA